MALRLGIYPTTRKLFPDTEPDGEKQIHLYGAENEVLSFQIAVRSDKTATVAVSGAEIFEQLYISTPRKAAWGFPQPLPCHPDALRKTERITLTPGKTTALWIRIKSSGVVNVGDQQVQVTVTRWPWELPRRPSLKTSIGLGGAGFARYYGVSLFSVAYWSIYKRYYDQLLDYRLSAYHLPFANVNDPAAKAYMADERVTTFRAEGLTAESWAHIKPTGKAWIYNFDEPSTREQFDEVKSNASGYHSMYPGIKYGIPFYTSAPGINIYEYLKGAVNLWIPQTDFYNSSKAAAKARQAAGDELWLYTSWAPRQGYCNLMINQLALEHRLLFWQLYTEDVTGYLYWHSTFWDWITDPWKDQATVGMSDPGIYGDGSLFYPLPDGGAPSLRLELAREGLQDYELLQKAVSVLGRNAVDGYVKRLTASLTNYTSDPVLFERVRVELGNAVAAKLSGNAGNESAGKDDIEMIPIKQDFIPVGRRNRPGHKLTPKYITIHTTANPNVGAAAHASYVKGNAAAAIPASWHFSVDDKEIYQHLPLTENGWHAGDGTNGTGNRQSIGIEICEYTDAVRQGKAIKNAAWLTAKLLREVTTLLPFPGCIKQHYDWSGKNCPRVLRGRTNGWADFLKQVQEFGADAPQPTGPLPKVDKNIGVKVDGKSTPEPGYLIDNGTYVRAAYLVGLVGGQVTGHGDHIKITLPAKVDTKKLEREIAALKKDNAALTAKITAARSALN